MLRQRINFYYFCSQLPRDSYLPHLTDCVHHRDGGSAAAAAAAAGMSLLWENQS